MSASVKAKTYPVPTEQLDRRTSFSKTYAVGPGRYEAYQSAIQIHAVHGDDRQEIDARFHESDGCFISAGPVITVTCAAIARVNFLTLSDRKQHDLSLDLEGAQPVKPVVPEPEKISAENPAERSFLAALYKAQGTLELREIYPGVTLRCHTDGQLANIFTFASPEAVREIALRLSPGKLRAEINKDQSITLSDEAGETVYTICPPALYDAAGNEGDVKVSLKETDDADNTNNKDNTNNTDNTLRICYTPDPAFTRSAVYPVTLDPVIRTETVSSSVVDTFVSSTSPAANYSTHERIYASVNGDLIRHGFLRFTSLPELGSNHFMTGAKIVLHSTIQPAETTAIYAREITESWVPSSVTYNAMPAWNTQVIQDYTVLYSDQQYTGSVQFDVTALARKWYHGTNYGVALTACEMRPCTGAFYSADSSVNGKPYLQIGYASLAGLEDYLTYDAVSAGRAGTGQVSLVNGNLIFLHQDTAMNGAGMPVSVTHVYNSCDADADPFGCGYGWRTNFHQTLHKEYLDDKVYYVYTDGDGTEHWFKPTTAAAVKYRDESGLSMELVPGTSSVTIRDKGDGIMTFPVISATPTASDPVTGKVLISSIADACGNTITVSAAGMKISRITDSAGRITSFTYSDGLLSRIKTPWHTNSACIAFTYTDSCLTAIRYEDLNGSGVRNSSSYTYSTSGGMTHRLLTRAAGPEGIIADLTYGNTGVVSGLPHVVLTAKCWDGISTIAANTSYEYGPDLCLVKDEITNNTLRYHFNDNGNCTGVDDGLGYAVFAEYDQSGANADAPVNHATSASRIQRVVNNLLADGLLCKTSGSAWTKHGTGTIEQVYNGSGFGRYERKFTVANGNTLYLRQTVSVTAGKTYTLSGFAQSLGAKAFLRVTAGEETRETFLSIPVEKTGSETQTELERTQVTFKVPSGISSITCDMVCQGTEGGMVAWWDSVQLEEGETANHVNLVENSRMNRTGSSGLPDCWIADSGSAGYLSWQNRSGCAVTMPAGLPGNALHVAGRWDRTIRAYQ
ncbi:MAG: DNRLRE domain-containing protein, partial [Clostridia bacterium]|nr:DNRLRE domain-containing protein [Clostridia bacterium]